ncbi:hypothetical protein C8R44DRAFT_759548 [Mycena epipterygia]|nr:hypothetical protein C8R44DRAFT_759548 [Mycena epipterygia]
MKMEPINPLDIQELLDQGIVLLHNSAPDLKACALVSRSWAGAAQRHLFRTISLMVGSWKIWINVRETCGGG